MLVFILFGGRVEAKVTISCRSISIAILCHSPTLEEELHWNAHGILSQLQIIIVGNILSLILVVNLPLSHSDRVLIIWRPALALISHVPLGLQLEEDESPTNLEDCRGDFTLSIQ